MLVAAGWLVQDYKSLNPTASMGIAVREYPTETGPADYILIVDRRPVGVIEAKRVEEGQRMVAHEPQAEGYASSKLKWFDNGKSLPFVYLSTGEITTFFDFRDPKPRSREVFSFHQPESIQEWLRSEKSLRGRLQDMEELVEEGLRHCQVTAINNLEQSFKENRPKALVQMATGSGKTFTAITSIYRLLEPPVRAKRILFLVDTKNLGEQAEQEFQSFTPNDDNRHFTELYSLQRLTSKGINKDAKVCISTIQRMYSILQGKDLDESLEQDSPYESSLAKEPAPVTYNPAVPIEMFDFIIIDECHRSIYNLWKQVLDYFDAFLIGLTATPDNRTYAFFNQNVVSEYTHEDAVRDKVNVPYEVFHIDTEITQNGAVVKKSEFKKEFRAKQTKAKRWEQIDEDQAYSAKQLDNSVVNFSQIRTVLTEFKKRLFTDLFPGRSIVPKTLIFAKTDSHADDIINVVREVFAEGNAFCRKVTYKADEDPKSTLAAFRNDYHPRMAVTVDMIATGTDVKALECLIFMRDVKSKNYFEQMIGRGTRTMSYDALQQRSSDVRTEKEGFVIVDAVGVFRSEKNYSQPLERKRTVSTKDLMQRVAFNNTDEDVATSLANRLLRLEKQMSDEEKQAFELKTGGVNLKQAASKLLNAFDPDIIQERAKTEGSESEASKALQREASDPFCKPDVRDYLLEVKRVHEQLIDNENIDAVTASGFACDQKDKAQETVKKFRDFLKEHKDELVALQIFYDQPYRRRELNFDMIQSLANTLAKMPWHLTIDSVWMAYQRLRGNPVMSYRAQLTDIVSILRFESGATKELHPFAEEVRKRFQDWVFKKQAGELKFTEAQMEWLRLIRDHIITSVHIGKDDLDLGKMASAGGLGQFYAQFGDDYEKVLDEMNEVLVA